MNIIRPKQLAKMLGISITTLWRMGKRGELPPRVQITKKVSGWRETDIQEWFENRTETQEKINHYEY